MKYLAALLLALSTLSAHAQNQPATAVQILSNELGQCAANAAMLAEQVQTLQKQIADLKAKNETPKEAPKK